MCIYTHKHIEITITIDILALESCYAFSTTLHKPIRKSHRQRFCHSADDSLYNLEIPR